MHIKNISKDGELKNNRTKELRIKNLSSYFLQKSLNL